MRIFVSYTTKDHYISECFLNSVSNVLCKISDHYIDILHNKASDKQSYVERMLVSSDLMLLLNSESINRSCWVSWEIMNAKKQGIPIVDIPIDKDNLDKSLNQIRGLFSRTSKS